MKCRLFIVYSAIIFALFLFLSLGISGERLRMATTTSLQDSGLLEYLLPYFEEKFNLHVDVIAVGTGKALILGENGDVDILFVHDPESEQKFIDDGFGVGRQEVMYNDFIIIGPRNNPADIKGHDAASAFRKIAEKKCFFVSRGDESGTHKKEKQLWKKANIDPQGEWYLEAGQGMGATLLIADEKHAYCLTDRATYNAYFNKIELTALCEGDSQLINHYSVIAVNPNRHPHVKYKYALSLINWLVSAETQKLISEFKKGDKALFKVNR